MMDAELTQLIKVDVVPPFSGKNSVQLATTAWY